MLGAHGHEYAPCMHAHAFAIVQHAPHTYQNGCNNGFFAVFSRHVQGTFPTAHTHMCARNTQWMCECVSNTKASIKRDAARSGAADCGVQRQLACVYARKW